MDLSKVCFGCFRETDSAVCPFCGFDREQEQPVLALPLGTILNGRYATGKVLGIGGFGITYLGWDLTLEVRVAIKEYLPSGLAARSQDHYSVSPLTQREAESFVNGQDCFLEEARTLAKLRQIPNIVSVESYFRENNTAYFVMDYIDGESLQAYLQKRGGRLPFAEALGILSPVMESLSAVHAQNLIHRDISPDNIFITSQGVPRLLDFGAAREAFADDKSRSVILKHGFAPEEQYRSHGQQGPWTDVYAMAATLYFCITAQLPPDSVDRSFQDTIVPPSSLGADIPKNAEDALMMALAVRAEDRFQNMDGFRRAMLEAARTAGIPLPISGATASAQVSGQPMYPAQPGVSGQPTYPAQPGVSGQPGYPAQPGVSGQPTYPAQPGVSGQPGYPAQPGVSGQPGYPAQPGVSGQPMYPAQPGVSGQPTYPAQPGVSGQPGYPAQPGVVGQTVYGGQNTGAYAAPLPPAGSQTKPRISKGLLAAIIGGGALVLLALILIPVLILTNRGNTMPTGGGSSVQEPVTTLPPTPPTEEPTPSADPTPEADLQTYEDNSLCYSLELPKGYEISTKDGTTFFHGPATDLWLCTRLYAEVPLYSVADYEDNVEDVFCDLMELDSMTGYTIVEQNYLTLNGLKAYGVEYTGRGQNGVLLMFPTENDFGGYFLHMSLDDTLSTEDYDAALAEGLAIVNSFRVTGAPESDYALFNNAGVGCKVIYDLTLCEDLKFQEEDDEYYGNMTIFLNHELDDWNFITTLVLNGSSRTVSETLEGFTESIEDRYSDSDSTYDYNDYYTYTGGRNEYTIRDFELTVNDEAFSSIVAATEINGTVYEIYGYCESQYEEEMISQMTGLLQSLRPAD